MYDGAAIPLSAIAGYHCHDGAHPVIHCFDTEKERDADASGPWRSEDRWSGLLSERRTVLSTGAATYYVTFYEHEAYGGASFTTAQALSNLSDYGWNDVITSFKSLNGQRPKWFEHAGYGSPTWQWAAGAWVSNVGGGANDKFSAVKNVP